MPIPSVTEFEGQLPAENEPSTFPARAEALFDWLVGQGMPEFNAAIAAVNIALNDNGTVLDTAGKAIALTTNAGTLVPTGGTGNAYTITPAVQPASYEDGQSFLIRVNRQNTGAVTFKVGTLAAVPLRKLNADGATFGELVAGDLRVGEVHLVGYNGTQFELLSTPLNRFVRNDLAQTITGAWAFNGALSFGNAAQVIAALAAVPASRAVSTGDGLTGGGNLGANRTLSVDTSVVRTSRTIGTTDGLVGGGTMAANRTIGMAASERMTTANVLGEIAGATAGAVGSYALLERDGTSTSVSPGATYAGSSLRWSGFLADSGGSGIESSFTSGVVGSGTWRAMGAADGASGSFRSATLFLRIA